MAMNGSIRLIFIRHMTENRKYTAFCGLYCKDCIPSHRKLFALKMTKAKIAIVGDFNSTLRSHILLNQSLNWLQEKNEFRYEWLETTQVKDEGHRLLDQYRGIWSAPGGPFKSLEGALTAIRYARERNIPHLGTCGGFQHTIIEIARNVLGITNAQHEEYESTSQLLIINRMACSLSGKTMAIKIEEKSQAFKCYKKAQAMEDYFCNFGINPNYRDKLEHTILKISGIDQDNEIRIMEIPKNDFFIATLFVPQTKATKEKPHPIIKSFIEECIKAPVSTPA
jgi:CTP synthase (UTP-ammonia lyase)